MQRKKVGLCNCSQTIRVRFCYSLDLIYCSPDNDIKRCVSEVMLMTNVYYIQISYIMTLYQSIHMKNVSNNCNNILSLDISAICRGLLALFLC